MKFIIMIIHQYESMFQFMILMMMINSDKTFVKEQEDCGLGEYMTIHITPEPQCSYVSFETNIPARY